jgi:hypothetical protein
MARFDKISKTSERHRPPPNRTWRHGLPPVHCKAFGSKLAIGEFFLVCAAAYVGSVLYHRIVLFQWPDPKQHFATALLLGATVARRPLSPTERFFKRLFDLVVAAASLILLAPLLVFVAVVIKLDSPGPMLFRQTRHGFNNKPIRVLNSGQCS